ncbi:uncharacterized protein WM277_017923 [Molossus nigricans]
MTSHLDKVTDLKTDLTGIKLYDSPFGSWRNRFGKSSRGRGYEESQLWRKPPRKTVHEEKGIRHSSRASGTCTANWKCLRRTNTRKRWPGHVTMPQAGNFPVRRCNLRQAHPQQHCGLSRSPPAGAVPGTRTAALWSQAAALMKRCSPRRCSLQ